MLLILMLSAPCWQQAPWGYCLILVNITETYSRYFSSYVVSAMLIGGTTMVVSHVRTELNHSIDVPHLQGRSLLCYSTEAGGLGAAWRPQCGTGAKPPISDFEQFRVYLGPVLLQNSHKNMSQLYTIVHS